MREMPPAIRRHLDEALLGLAHGDLRTEDHLDELRKHLQVYGLHKEAIETHFLRSPPGGFVPIGRNHDHGEPLSERKLANALKRLEAIHAGHHIIQDDQVHLFVFQGCKRFFPAHGSTRPVSPPPKDKRKHLQAFKLIINDENGCHANAPKMLGCICTT